MKRFVFVLVFIVIIVVGIGFFLPSQKTFSTTVNASLPFDGISRVMVNKGQWQNWWPGNILNDSTVVFKETPISINLILLNGFKGSATEKNLTTDLDLQCITTYNAETAMTLNTVIHFSSNPLTKVFQYLGAASRQKKYEELLTQLKEAFSDVKKVYGFDIQMGKVPNSAYISTKNNFDYYPSNEEIYKMIDEIRTYILSANSKVMNDPILNIVKENDHSYMAMVALAADRELPAKGKFMPKNMMLGNIVVAQVIGGPATIEKCRQAVQFYVNDFRKISPAIAFERMITNRLTEKDSSRWVTSINYPVFQ